jgi:hypothetical protein
MGALATGEDSHAGGPAGELVPARAFPQQHGQLGDVGLLFAPAPRMRAPVVLAGVLSAALTRMVKLWQKLSMV